METTIVLVENRCQLRAVGPGPARPGACRRDPCHDGAVSNRRRTAADRSRSQQPEGHHGHQVRPRRSRPFGGGRDRVNVHSHTVLRRLHALPRWTVPLATAVLVFVGLYSGAVIGGLCLLVVAGFLGWLVYLSWPRLSRNARLVRLLVLGLVVGTALARLSGLWG
jgi:hypothetical protein